MGGKKCEDFFVGKNVARNFKDFFKKREKIPWEDLLEVQKKCPWLFRSDLEKKMSKNGSEKRSEKLGTPAEILEVLRTSVKTLISVQKL